MSHPVYYVEADDTLPIFFDTFDGKGASITMTGFATSDIEIYKDGGLVQRSSDAGFTVDTDHDAATGIHSMTIDLSDNTDAGFYAVGSWYHVVVNSVTIDSQTVRFVAAAFRIVSATRGMAGTALPDAAADAAGGLPISDAGGLDLDGRLDADVSSRATQTSVDTVDSNVDAILLDTAEIGTAGAGLTAVPWNSSWDTEVQSECTDALNAYDPPTKAELDAGFAALNDVSEAQVNAQCDTAISDAALATAASIAALNDLSAADVNAEVDSALNTAIPGSPTAGSINERLKTMDDADIPGAIAALNDVSSADVNAACDTAIADASLATAASIAALNDLSSADVNAACDTALADYDGPTKAEMDAGFAALNDVSAADVNAQCDAAIETYGLDHLVSAAVTGTDVADNSIIARMASSAATADWDTFVNTDDSLQAISESGGGGPTAAAIADAVWDEAQADHTGAGTFGEIATEIADILLDTAEIGAAGAGLSAIPWNSAWDSEVESEVDDALIAKGLDHLVATSVTGTDVADGSIIAQMVASGGVADWDTFVNTTDSLQAIRDEIGTAADTDLATDIAAVASAISGLEDLDAAGVWAHGTRTLTSLGNGSGLTSIPWNAAWDTEVQSECTDALNAYDPPTNAEMEARTIAASAYFNPASDTVANVTNVATINSLAPPSNWNLLAIDGSGRADAMVQGFLNAVIAESSGGRIAGNFQTFYDNADAATTQTVDDVGGGAGGGGYLVIHTGTATAGGTNTITLAGTASTSTGIYVGQWIYIDSGTGAGQVRLITAYSGAAIKQATVDRDWTIEPDATSVYEILPAANIYDVDQVVAGGLTEAQTAAAVWGADRTTYDVVDTMGGGITRVIGNVNGNVAGNVVGTIGGFDTTAKAEIEAEVDDALVARGLHYLVDTAVGSGVVALNSVFAKVVDNTLGFANWDSYAPNAASLKALELDISLIGSSDATLANQTAILNALGSWTGSGNETILGAFQSLMRDDGPTLTDIGGGYSPASHSLEAGFTTVGVTAVYSCIVNYAVDEDNTQDEYRVIWLKNGVAVEAADITLPKISASTTDGGSALFTDAAMTLGVTTPATYKYDASGAERQTAGEAVSGLCKATIDGEERTFPFVASRDTSAS